MPNVRKMLDLSTAHLTQELLDELPAYDQYDGAPSWGGTAAVYPTEYGAIMWVPDDPDESSAAGDEPVPAVVLVIQKHARKHGCDYVLFDADGPTDDELPVFGEEAQACTSCGGSRTSPAGCLSCCRDCGFPCSIGKDAEAFHADTRDGLAHEKDEDCDVDPETLTCRGCGVDHGGPCDLCGGRGFHKTGCPNSDATEGRGLLLVIEEAEDDFAILQVDGVVMREGLHRNEVPGAFAECIDGLAATEPVIEEEA